MATGYVKVHREVMDHPVFDDEWLLKVFLWCIMQANFREGRVQRGSFTTGRFEAARLLKADPSRVYRAFKRLESLGCIKVASNTRFTIVSVCNYSTYQSDEETQRTAESKPQKSNNKKDDLTPLFPGTSDYFEAPERTTIEQRSNNDRTLIEEGKNAKKGRKRDTSQPRPQVTVETVTIPPALDTTDARAALSRWLDYKRIRREAYKSASFVENLLAEFAPHGAAAFIQSVNASMGRNYAGVFPPKGTPNGKPRIGPGQTYDPNAAIHDPEHGKI